MMRLRIGWLYPRQMSTYGDRGNVLALSYRCRRREIAVDVVEVDLGLCDVKDVDIFIFGGGQDRNQAVVSADLMEFKAQALREAVGNQETGDWGAVVLGVCGGFQLLGHFYVTREGQEIKGLGLLDVATAGRGKRAVGHVVVQPDERLGLRDKLVGFENHSGKTTLGRGRALGHVELGQGNAEDGLEGAWYGNVFGTYLHGPVLAKNPEFCDMLIQRALQKRHGQVELAVLDDTLETEMRKRILEEVRA